MSDNLELPQVATNQNNKETTINDQAAKLDGALTDLAEIDLTGATSPLTLGKSDTLDALFLKLIGANPGAPFEVVVPDNKKAYAAWNTSGEEVTVKTVGGTGVDVPHGKVRLVYCDGINVIDLAGAVGALSDVGDVSVSGLADNELLRRVAASGEWQNVTIATMLALASIGALSDVDLSGIATGEGLFWDGAKLAPAASGGNVARLLDDTITADGVETDFTLSAEPDGTLLVFVDGLIQDEDDYSVVTTTLSFNSAPADGAHVIAYDVGSNSAAVRTPYDLAATIPGTQGDGALLFEVVFTRNVEFPDDFAGSQLFARTAASAETVLDIQKNGSSIGTVTIAAAGATCTFATLAGGASFAAGDRIALINQSPADATLADVSITLKGTRTS